MAHTRIIISMKQNWIPCTPMYVKYNLLGQNTRFCIFGGIFHLQYTRIEGLPDETFLVMEDTMECIARRKRFDILLENVDVLRSLSHRELSRSDTGAFFHVWYSMLGMTLLLKRHFMCVCVCVGLVTSHHKRNICTASYSIFRLCPKFVFQPSFSR